MLTRNARAQTTGDGISVETFVGYADASELIFVDKFSRCDYKYCQGIGLIETLIGPA